MTDHHPSQPRVIVTGGSGLIGSAVIERMAQRYQMTGFDRAGAPYPPPEAESVSVDLTSDESLARGLARVRYAYGDRLASVIHLAAYVDFSGEPSPLYEEVTVKGTERLLRALRDFDVEQFIFSSTMLVHKPTEPGRPVDETWPLEGQWEYPKSKIEAEALIRAERGTTPVVLCRLAGVYTDRCESPPLAQQIRRVFERRVTGRVFPGDTSHGQAFVHLDDVTDAFERMVGRRETLPDDVAILIGEPETPSYDDLQRAIARLIHGDSNWQTESIPKAVAKTGAWVRDQIPGIEEPFIKPWMIDRADDHYELDVSRASTLLGWRSTHGVMQTLPRMVSALLEDPASWYRLHGMTPSSAIEARAHALAGEGR